MLPSTPFILGYCVAGILISVIISYLIYTKLAHRRSIAKQFSPYLSPSMVKKLPKDPNLLKLGGETRELSIMFTGVRDFDKILNHYGTDAQGLTKIINRYMTAMTANILGNKGTLGKYIGDAQMAFWNAPLYNPNHAKDAVRAALDMLGSLDAFNKEISQEGIPPFRMGIGINTGAVIVGNMGTAQRWDYTCIGPNVSLASRLGDQSACYQVALMIGPKTYQQIRTEHFCLLLDIIEAEGNLEGAAIYTVLDKVNRDDKEWDRARTRHRHMMDDYFAQRFKEVVIQCKTLKGSFDGQMDGYYDMWIDRCLQMSKFPPSKDWGKIYRARSN